MIWVYLCIIATFVAIIGCIVYGICNEWWTIGEKIMYPIGAGLVTFLLGALLMCLLNTICYSPSNKLELKETHKIYSLKDNTYLSGYGGLISVRIEEDDKYTYVAINEDGTYSKKSIESTDVKIKEVDNGEPRLEVYIRKSKNEFWSIEYKECYCFVVPKGTVINTFSIDLE